MGDVASKLLKAIEDGSLFRNPEFWHAGGVAASREGDIKAAILRFGVAVKLDPSNPCYLIDLGLAYLENGQEDLANKLVERGNNIYLQEELKEDVLVQAEGLLRCDAMLARIKKKFAL